ncbi:type I methionyl aminopeptidase [Paenibacillus sacheonensis]|uniref:Methionine aminopeptidase n=1 Tax=Paenibacillus sacheonensis TaxID=742054 RepID=A0A7X4YU91_9BACL|nr:type I methionyl aminopeptidase [Paenibacillus sacheonensis]MBM7568930.1 methionyl aminopeptidase [Paenibacillus sacheonensis]NBC72695.1 type I methionyl aminopeptidase [Paenibacillus sacheonensis]
MIQYKTREEIERMRKAGRIVAACHREIGKRLKPGATTLEIDRFAEAYMVNCGAKPAQKGYKGYPYATCASACDVVCHGFPRDVPLREGEIVTIDMVVELDGWMADSAWTYAVGRVDREMVRLMNAAKTALYQGIAQAAAGNRLGDIGHAVQAVAKREQYGIVEAFIGHGIGRRIHEDPQVHHTGKAGTGRKLREGMVITIEPIFVTGRPHISIDADGWTARTLDGSWGAQFEHTVAVTSGGPIILT